jgi:hypothetical protein
MRKRLWWFTRNAGKKAVIVSLVTSLLLQTTCAAQVIVNHFPANRGPGYTGEVPHEPALPEMEALT